MKAKKKVDDSKYLDPVFAEYGMKVYTNEYAQMIRKDNLEKKSNGKKITNLIPQEGFQETVYLADADVLIIGGKKGGGKAQPKSATVRTPNGGRVLMGGIKGGDVIVDENDNPQTVLGVFDQGLKPIYKVNTECGSTECVLEHLWTIYTPQLGVWDVVTTQFICQLLQNGYDCYIPKFKGGINKIVGIEDTGRVEDCRCILVSGENHLYVTDNDIVTHNTWISLFKALDYIFNPDVIMRGFRKYEDDIERGIWSASKQVFKGFGTPVRSSYEWQFLGGRGASMRMEHLQDLGKISDRFRGSELAYIDIEELAEHTKDNVNVIFDFLSVNRNTAGVKSQLVATCNPVGKSNKLRLLLDWYIDPETDTIIPERDGKVRYMFNYGSDISEIAWGNTWKEAYDNPAAKAKIDALCEGKNLKPQDLILTLQFIEGDYADNKILQNTDSRYVSRLAAKGGESVVNDLSGVWRDIDSGTSLVSVGDMENFFAASEHSSSDDVMRASADVAIVGDFLVMWAARGHHIVDVEGLVGMSSDSVIPAIEQFLKKNGVHKENFTFDENGLGIWLRESSAFARSRGFNNKSAPSDTRLYNNLKSECADKFIDEIHRGVWSIDERLKYKKFRDTKGNVFTLYDRMMSERLALKRKDDTPRWEIISKQQMKAEIGHSPDFIEGLFMMEQIFLQPKKEIVRRGFGAW